MRLQRDEHMARARVGPGASEGERAATEGRTVGLVRQPLLGLVPLGMDLRVGSDTHLDEKA